MVISSQNNPTTLKLKPDQGGSGSVKVSVKYVPVKMDLDPSESINNMGKLRLDILDAQDLPAADRNGKSDPYAKFELNGVEIHKTKTQKKTLNPTWNEFFEVEIPSRTASNLTVKVYDWDFADKPDFLGAAQINLESLDPFKASESRYLLDGKSGSVRLRLLFRPDYVTRMRQGTSTFGGTFANGTRVFTGVAGAPIKGGVAVAGVVGSGVGKGATFLRRGLFGKKDDDSSLNGSVPTIMANGGDSPADSTEVSQDRPTTSGASAPSPNNHSRTRSFGASSVRSSVVPGGPAGTATFTIVGATGYPPSSDLYVMITQITPKQKTVGKTKHFKSNTGQWSFDETFKLATTPEAQFKIEVKGEHMLGSDDDLGEHIYFVDESGAAGTKELSVGSGTVSIRSNFQSADSSLGADSPKSHMRRSFLSKRDAGRNSREVTPNP
jgi:hypothetical protein